MRRRREYFYPDAKIYELNNVQANQHLSHARVDVCLFLLLSAGR